MASMTRSPFAHRRALVATQLLLAVSLLDACSSRGGGVGQPAGEPLSVAESKAREVPLGAPVAFDLDVAGGVQPLAFDIVEGDLPDGLGMNDAGEVRGVTTTPGEFRALVSVRDSSTPPQAANVPLVVIVGGVVGSVAGPLASANGAVPSGAVGEPFAHHFDVVGGTAPFHYSIVAGELPAGLSLGAGSGWVSGTPTVAGVYPVTLKVTDSAVAPAELSLSTSFTILATGEAAPWFPAIVASQTSGVAPLGVVFDSTIASFPGVARPFHELAYNWDFSDPQSDHPTTSGAVAAHVFTQPGVYQVRLSVTGPLGFVNSSIMQITVTAPNQAFAGTNTICVSASGNFSGAPAGALHITTNNFDQALNHCGPGKRLLFRRGEDFYSTSSDVVTTSGQSQIGAFGAGVSPDSLGIYANNPTIHVSNGKTAIRVEGEGLRVTDLHFTGANSIVLDTTRRVVDLLCFRLSSDGVKLPLLVNHFIPEYWQTDPHTGVVVANNHHTNFSNTGAFVGGEQIGFVRNKFERSTGTHVLRFSFARRMVLDGNVAADPVQTRHALKLHAQQDVNQYGRYTERVVIRGNKFTGDANWLVTVGPQNAVSDEAIRDVVIDRNHFHGGDGTMIMALINAADTTIRNNIFTAEGNTTWGVAGIQVSQRGIEPLPQGVEVYHNTYHNVTGSNSQEVFVDIRDHIGMARVSNNLMHAPNSSAQVVSGRTYGSSNLLTATPGFIDPANYNFHPGPNSPANGAGVPVPVYFDFDGLARTNSDIGAFRY